VPFLRVLRDKRGYETTYLVHWFRDGNRQRSRILYAFRTPPGVRVGRDVLDPSVVREIEEQHPDIQFDWRALLENRQVIDQAGESRRQRPKKKPVAVAAPPAEVVARRAEAAGEGGPPRIAVPSAIEGETRELQLAFLGRWYPELRDRIPHRTQDPIRREALLALVERLNAAAWETEERVVAGLQNAAEALQRLSRVFSKRRRRSKRSKPQNAEASAQTPESESGAESDVESSSADESA
jgi:hypothetical protein